MTTATKHTGTATSMRRVVTLSGSAMGELLMLSPMAHCYVVTVAYRRGRRGADIAVELNARSVIADVRRADGYEYPGTTWVRDVSAVLMRLADTMRASVYRCGYSYGGRTEPCPTRVARDADHCPDHARIRDAWTAVQSSAPIVGAGIGIGTLPAVLTLPELRREASLYASGSREARTLAAAVEARDAYETALARQAGPRTAPLAGLARRRYVADDVPTGALAIVGAGVGVGIHSAASVPMWAPETERYADIRADKAFGTAVGAAYLSAISDVDNPDVTAAYAAFTREVWDQFHALPVDVAVVPDDPYETAGEMFADIEHRGRLLVLASSTTGTSPMLSPRTNDAFRAVHDFNGHYMSGRGFDRHGEEAAYQRHVRMFSPLARRALATETRGQSSAFIWHLSGKQFPAQKACVLPDWCTAVPTAR